MCLCLGGYLYSENGSSPHRKQSNFSEEGGPHSNTILHFLKFIKMRSPSDIIFIMLKAVT